MSSSIPSVVYLHALKKKIVTLHASLIKYSRCYQKEKTTGQLPPLLTIMHSCIMQGHAFYHGQFFFMCFCRHWYVLHEWAIHINTSNNERLEKCARCVLLLYIITGIWIFFWLKWDHSSKCLILCLCMKTIRAKQAKVHSSYFVQRDQHGIIAKHLT